MPPPPLQPTNEQLRALALALRDKYLADARQAMRIVRTIERQYGLEKASTKERANGV